MATTGIYCITNNITGEKYVGQSRNIERRWEDHRKPSRLSYSNALYKAFNKYGISNFTFSIIEAMPSSSKDAELDESEQFWIKKTEPFNNGYNETTGGRSITESKMRHRIPSNFAFLSNQKEDVVPIVKLDQQFNVLSIYPSVSECSRQNGVPASNISKVARGERKTAHSFIFMYYKDIQKLNKEGITLLRKIQTGAYNLM